MKVGHAISPGSLVAEGVETDELQGYLFAKPMPPDRLALWAMGDDGVHMADFRPSIYATASQTLQ